jgi:hypothetical protein
MTKGIEDRSGANNRNNIVMPTEKRNFISKRKTFTIKGAETDNQIGKWISSKPTTVENTILITNNSKFLRQPQEPKPSQ